ncbi:MULTISPECIES: alpha/beta fold hydrolase [unclassified Streptomyces]|uniref:alpha/beta fold hydrolase n=1 Tax=unclassified Streptomyces TaxID=2593676 RepID=UPI00226E24C4|nr:MULTISPECIES: alpha/beta hydrolase [unclassified Streptomyces]MCY0917394.1 alpha/beta hydrolase [Streptomyces sp. H27-G5]MCY0959224.1 alpha/beta hydrolase [Streptomyces sp. H27-H5]
MTDLETRTLDATGATLGFDVRRPTTGNNTGNDNGNGNGTGKGGAAGESTGGEPRALLLVGSPMGADGFRTLASHFTDRTVVTYDPRGVGRSARTDGAAESSPEEHADDLRRVIEALGVGAVDVFASSGGAVNALTLVERHGGLVHTLIAHEPPLARVLPDREAALAACADIHRTYLREGTGPAMAKFFVLVSHQGPLPDDWTDRPAPSPADFGLPTEDDGSREDPLLGQNMRGCTAHRPDFTALRAAPTRIVVAAGKESGEQFPARAAAATAAGLGTPLALFPSDHGGFLGGEYGQHGAPEEFARTLREVLDTNG